MESVFLNGNKVGEWEESESRFIFRRNSSHLYRNLNAFCVNKNILEMKTWKSIMFEVLDVGFFSISRRDFEILFENVNMYVSFGAEKQIAIPIVMMERMNPHTLRIETSASTVKDFIQTHISKEPYLNWKGRINVEYFIRGN